jgi:hypothetical protein
MGGSETDPARIAAYALLDLFKAQGAPGINVGTGMSVIEGTKQRALYVYATPAEDRRIKNRPETFEGFPVVWRVSSRAKSY